MELVRRRDQLQLRLMLAERLQPEERRRFGLDLVGERVAVAEQNDRMRRRREAMHIELGSFILEHFEMVIWPALEVKGICKLWRVR